MSHIGIAIDQRTNDLFLRDDGSLAVVLDAEAVGQHVRQRLKTFEGEWFLDNTAGVPWLQEILGKGYDPALSEAVIKGEILDTHGVTELADFNIGYSRATRELLVRDVSVFTVYNARVSV